MATGAFAMLISWLAMIFCDAMGLNTPSHSAEVLIVAFSFSEAVVPVYVGFYHTSTFQSSTGGQNCRSISQGLVI